MGVGGLKYLALRGLEVCEESVNKSYSVFGCYSNGVRCSLWPFGVG